MKRFVPVVAAAPAVCAVQQRQYILPPTPLSFGGFGGTRTNPPWLTQRRVGLHFACRLPTVYCMMEAPKVTDQQIYQALYELYHNIPDKTLVTLRQYREQTAQKLALGSQGLDDKSELFRGFVNVLLNGEPEPAFTDDGTLRVAAAAEPVPVPVTFQDALKATAGLVLRKLPKPRFSPYCPPTIDLADLSTRDFHMHSPVKAVVDVILNHEAVIVEADVKKLVNEGDMDSLPAIAKPPPGAVHVNHFTQVACIAAGVNKWHVMKFITFQSDVEQGQNLSTRTLVLDQLWEQHQKRKEGVSTPLSGTRRFPISPVGIARQRNASW